MWQKWHIFFIMWVSWAWKWTLLKALKEQNKIKFHIPLSYKTRAPREHEKNWIDAHFISVEEFKKSIDNHEFLEYAIVHGKEYYGTKYEDVIENWINKGKIVVKELDINGLKRLQKEKPELRPFYTTIFLNIPVDILKERIEKRGDNISDDELERRINSAIIEEEESKKYCDYLIDATKTPIEVKNEVMEIIQNVLKKKKIDF